MAHDRITYGSFFWDFVRLDGQPQLPQRKLKTIKMPGVWGKAFKLMSVEADPARVVMEAAAVNEADEIDWIAAMFELTARPVGLYTGTGLLYQNQVFHEVRHERSVKMAVAAWGPVDLGADARLLTFSATVEYPFGV
jgi:hypothetical protein